MTKIADLIMVSLDSPDPRAHAEFYHRVLGWEITASADEYAMISDGHTSIGFGLVEGYQPPAWPDTSGGKRYHLDFYVDDLDKAEASCVQAGAARPDFQPGGDRWRVLTDPAGQPFCVCLRPQD
ncbi:VOC family protein [Plantactinospora solaniradicis]|uniref:VOC family protein n=1 Tax=Plantactinospora solaniradicis TaxID=1723736 RepID=A0ABW1KJL5_9ACTN